MTITAHRISARFVMLCGLVCAPLVISVAQERPANDLCTEAMTTAEMQDCLSKHFEAIDRELNRVYQQVMSQLNTARKAKLRDAHRRWVLFRDANAEYEASEVEGGTMYSLVYLSALASMTEKRVNELKAILEQMDSR